MCNSLYHIYIYIWLFLFFSFFTKLSVRNWSYVLYLRKSSPYTCTPSNNQLIVDIDTTFGEHGTESRSKSDIRIWYLLVTQRINEISYERVASHSLPHLTSWHTSSETMLSWYLLMRQSAGRCGFMPFPKAINSKLTETSSSEIRIYFGDYNNHYFPRILLIFY